MNHLNSIILEGNLLEDCVVTEPTVGISVGKMPIGVERFYKNRDNETVKELSTFDIECYGRMAEYAGEHAKKGIEIRVVGRLKNETWTDSEQKNHSRVYVVAEHIEYRKSKKQEVENGVQF